MFVFILYSMSVIRGTKLVHILHIYKTILVSILGEYQTDCRVPEYLQEHCVLICVAF